MKQLVQDVRSGGTRVVEVPPPSISPGMVRVRTVASVVSPGTERAITEFAAKSLLGKARSRPDLVRQVLDKMRRDGVLATVDAVRNRLDQPLPLGYSSAGRVVQVGAGVSKIKPGDRVACAGGGYAVHAEQALIPKNLVVAIPDGVSTEAAAFSTLGSVALHAFRLAQVQVGSRVAVIGLGVLGQLALQVARAAGCEAFGVDLWAGRVGKAQTEGFEAVERGQAEAASGGFTGGQGFDAVLICADTSSSDPLELAGEIARDRASVIAVGAVGMDVPRRTFYEKELSFRVSRSYGPGRYDPSYEEAGIDYPLGYVRWTEGRNLEAFLGLLATGRVDPIPLITHRFSIDDAVGAYELIADDRRQGALGMLIEYPQGEDEPGPAGVVVAPRPAQAEASVRLGVLGAGHFATQIILPMLRKLEGVDLVAVASGRGLSAGDAAERFGFAYAAADEEALLQDQNINTIAIVTRHHLHAGQAVSALGAGKHVFCEKPLAIDPEGLERVGEALDGNDRLLTVGFNRRWAPLMVELKAFFRPVSTPLMMHYRVNAGPLPEDHWLLDPEQGGGRIVGEVCHFIDALTDVCGALPSTVYAISPPGPEGKRDFEVSVTFEDGSVGTVSYVASGDGAQGKEKLEVFGGGRSASLEGFRRLETYVDGRKQVSRAWLRRDKGHRGLWQAFVDAVQRGGPSPIPYGHLFAVTEATFAAEESLRTGRPVPVDGPASIA